MNVCETSSKSVGFLKRLCEEGHFHDALHLVDCMEQPVSADIFYMLIDWSIRYKDLLVGRNVHRLIIKSGLEADVFLGNNLIRMFGLCGSLPEVNQVFSKLYQPNTFTWSVTIAAYANLGLIEKAIQLCDYVQISSINAGDYIFTTILKACGNMSALCQGKMVHDFAVRTGLESVIVVANALIDMYFRCGSSGDARKVFDKVSNRDVVTWTATLAGYVQLLDGAKALQLFEQMKSSGIEPNRVTYTSTLRACASMGALLDGKLLHAQIVEQGFDQPIVIGNTLIDMYAKCCSLMDGLRVFERLTNKNIVSWTAIIEGYINDADGTGVLSIFGQMLKGGWKPDNVLFLTLLKACHEVLTFSQLKLIHSYAVEDSFESDSGVSSSLVNMYINHGSLENAFILYNTLSSKNLVTCTTMIAGLVEDGHSEEALKLFWSMLTDGLEPDNISFISILKACPSVAGIDKGRLIHTQIVQAGLEEDVKIGSALVDLYSKNGDSADARRVLDALVTADAVTWTAMIAGYVEAREYTSALLCFKDMQKRGIEPDEVTFVCVLSACTHMGLVDEGCHLFMLMRDTYGITPGFDHYDCITNLLGHAGHVTIAGSILHTFPHGHNSTGWISLLGHCTSYGNTELGKECFNHIPFSSSSDGVLMPNSCAEFGMLDHTADVGGCKSVQMTNLQSAAL